MNLFSSFFPVCVGKEGIQSFRPGNDQLFLAAVSDVTRLLSEGASEEKLLAPIEWVIALYDQANTGGPNNGTYLDDSIDNLRQLVPTNLSEVGTWVQY